MAWTQLGTKTKDIFVTLLHAETLQYKIDTSFLLRFFWVCLYFLLSLSLSSDPAPYYIPTLSPLTPTVSLPPI